MKRWLKVVIGVGLLALLVGVPVVLFGSCGGWIKVDGSSPVSVFKEYVGHQSVQETVAAGRRFLEERKDSKFLRGLNHNLVQALLDQELPLIAAPAELVLDHPDKVRGLVRRATGGAFGRWRVATIRVAAAVAASAAPMPAQQVITLEEALNSALSRSPTIEAADAAAAAASSVRRPPSGLAISSPRACRTSSSSGRSSSRPRRSL